MMNPFDFDDEDLPTIPDWESPEADLGPEDDGYIFDADKPECPIHHTPLAYRGDFSPPAVGRSWVCPEGPHFWVEVSGWLFNPDTGIHLQDPWEVA